MIPSLSNQVFLEALLLLYMGPGGLSETNLGTVLFSIILVGVS